MYDLAIENAKPGQCEKCRGTGQYSWGTVTSGKPANSGMCYSCRGTGKQDVRQIKRNACYNRHKIVRIGL